MAQDVTGRQKGPQNACVSRVHSGSVRGIVPGVFHTPSHSALTTTANAVCPTPYSFTKLKEVKTFIHVLLERRGAAQV